MILPIRTDYQLRRTPWVNYGLLAANILIFLIGFNTMDADNYRRTMPWMLHADWPQVYQFFSSMFLHANWMHLLGNMVFLWVFGNALNDRFGHVGYLSFYLAGGLLAGLGYLLLTPSGQLLGASGAISAVTGAFLVLLPKTRVTVITWLFYVLLPFEVSSLFFLAFQFVFNMWMSLQALGTASSGGVAYAAHSAGYVYGIGLAAALLAVHLLPRDAFDLLNLINSWRRRMHYRRMVARGYDPWQAHAVWQRSGEPRPRRRVASESRPERTASQREMQLRAEIADACGRHDMDTAARKYLQLVQIAEEAVLSRDNQLDVANHLMSQEQYPAAADAYERFRRQYPTYENIGDVNLMLGLIYGRYLEQYEQAREAFSQALEQLREERKRQLARDELSSLKRKT